MSKRTRLWALALIAGTLVPTMSPSKGVHAYPTPLPVDLGSAAAFGVLGGATVTNTGPTIVTGDLGVSPGSAVTGFPPGTVTGTIHAGDPVADQAQADALLAYNDAASRAPDANLSGQDLGGQTLAPGVYRFDTSAGLTGVLTLDGQGDPNAGFIFQVGSALTTASSSRVALINGATTCNVIWQLGSSGTLGTNSSFAGTILAAASVTATTSANVYGRLLARVGAVTVESNAVTPTCASALPQSSVSKTVSPSTRPAPGGNFTYTVTVTNDGPDPTTLTALTDSIYGDLNGQGSCATGGLLAPGQSYACAFVQSFTGVAGDTETDTVTSVTTDASGIPSSASDDATISLTAPSVRVDKTASPTSRPAPGGSFQFSVRVTNTSPNPATLTSLLDDVYGDLNGSGSCTTGGIVASQSTYTCAFDGTFNGPAGARETDTVTATLTDVNGNAASASDSATVFIAPTGVLEICKVASNVNGPVTGNYRFRFLGRVVTVPVGACTGPLTVPAGEITVDELDDGQGAVMVGCTTRPVDRLVSCRPSARRAVVRVLAGDVANETILTITNRVPAAVATGAIKVCKIAGPGVVIGTEFTFTVGTKTVVVEAGPADQGGYCKIVGGFVRGSEVRVVERARTGTTVTKLTVAPSSRRVATNRSTRTARVTVGSGATVVSFTNSA